MHSSDGTYVSVKNNLKENGAIRYLPTSKIMNQTFKIIYESTVIKSIKVNVL